MVERIKRRRCNSGIDIRRMNVFWGLIDMDNDKILSFIKQQKVAFICSIDEDGFPNVKAMLKPRKIDGLHSFFFNEYIVNESKTVYE